MASPQHLGNNRADRIRITSDRNLLKFLLDCPGTYVGSAGKPLVVANTEDCLIFKNLEANSIDLNPAVPGVDSTSLQDIVIIQNSNITNIANALGYTKLTFPFTIPSVGSTNVADVESSLLYTIGDSVVLNDGFSSGNFEVTNLSPTTLTLKTTSSSSVGGTVLQDTYVTKTFASSVYNYANVIPDGTKDGVNDLFTLPGSQIYNPNTLIVYLNGIAYNPTSITKISPAYTSFRIVSDTLPNISLHDVLSCSYVLA